MKSSSLLLASALAAVAAVAAGFAAGVAVLPALAAFTAVMIALLGVHDYAPRAAYTRALAADLAAEARPLAA